MPTPRSLAALACAIACMTGAWAQSGDRDQEQLKRLKLQMRQVQQEKASLEEAQSRAAQEKSALEQALKSAQVEASDRKASAGTSARKLATLGAELAALKQERTTLAGQVATLQTQLEESKAQAAANHAGAQALGDKLAGLQADHERLNRQHALCRQDNAKLVQLGETLLSRYEHKGLGEVIGAKEPFFQTARVTLENQAAEYRRQLEAATAKP